MKKTILYLALVIVLTSLGSCKKILVTSDNKAKTLVDKKWKLTAYTENGQDMLHTVYEDCELDDITIYRSNGTVETDQAETKCDPVNIEITLGKWELENNLLTMGEDGTGIQLVFNVVEISSTTLRMTIKNPVGTEIFAYTFTAQ